LPACTLHIGSRVVARSEAGPLDAEYALFEAHEIELRSNNEPGSVREHGYATTAVIARERLEADGVTRELAAAVVEAIRPALAEQYARGPMVRRVVPLLDVGELLEGGTYDAAAKRYDGTWLDLAALARDTGIERASTALQALHLAALLSAEPASAPVVITTGDYTRERRPGERTLRRVGLSHAGRVVEAIRAMASRGPSAERDPTRDTGPNRREVQETLRSRAVDAPEGAQERLAQIERALAARE
jgi:hypothetical protein